MLDHNLTNLTIGTYVFFLGACIGSFLNVCIYRIPADKSVIYPGSFCPNCSTPIPFYLNIPILSYLVLLGKCKFCKIPISVRYPAIELLTALLVLALYLKFSMTLVFVYWMVFTCVLITVSFIDLDHQIIPDIISLPGIAIFASSFYFLPEMNLLRTGLGILAGGGILYAVALFYYLVKKQEGMGGGDIKLLAMIGAATGVEGVVFTIFASSLTGSIIGGGILLTSKNADGKIKIPFGPFLSAGALLYIFFGKILIEWYMSLLNQ